MEEGAQIRAVIQTYFDGMYESSSTKTQEAFHPDAWISGDLPHGPQQMTVAQFADFVAAQQPSPQAQGLPARLDVVSLDIAGHTAVARVRDDYLGMPFLDTLSFIKQNDRWCIMNKLFHVES